MDDKQRFELKMIESSGLQLIRASQGHTMKGVREVIGPALSVKDVPDVAGDQSLSPARLKASASTAATRGGVPVIQHPGVMSDQLAGRLERRAATNRSRCHGR